uniref:Uncharacterized protein n=1 Tax=Parascaris univalens TaxID=6257 RepID=A0A915CJF0_PARUN
MHAFPAAVAAPMQTIPDGQTNEPDKLRHAAIVVHIFAIYQGRLYGSFTGISRIVTWL